MQLPATPFQLYEPGNTNDELSNNGRCVSTLSIVTMLQVVIRSGLGYIRSKSIP